MIDSDKTNFKFTTQMNNIITLSDLTQLQSLTIDTIIQTLHERYKQRKYYTGCGKIIIAVSKRNKQ